MTSDASVPSSVPIAPESSSNPSPPAENGNGAEPLLERDQQVRLKSEGGKLLLMLPPEGDLEEDNPASTLTWNEVSQQIRQRLHSGERLWQAETTVHLIARDRLLDGRQLQEIGDALSEVQLRLKRVYTSRRQTAVAAATAGYSVEQQSSIAQINQSNGDTPQALVEPLYLQTTLRSGADVQHNGTVVVLGDLNPGSSVVADGDILVWGRLRGLAHAGAKGNARALIMALQMEPTQLRIANFVARPPETPPAEYYPEVAYVTAQGAIRIARAIDFYRQGGSDRQ
ncbi:MAG: septum site-determining protein MinC [Oscillatoriales cyanobacterium C42_A2020_001]|nr:septum site-determining protein MinC [Leptolyngbyaceae cyanobacterium C42_A2020_001]